MLADTSIVRNKRHNKVLRGILRLRRIVATNKRDALNKDIAKKLSGIEFTVLTNNCLGGVFYHDAGRQFTSPTVNLAFDGEDFIKFCSSPKDYLNEKFNFFTWPGIDYPLVKVKDIELRMVHYHSEDECLNKWKSRAERIVWNNIFIIATDVDGLYKNKWMEAFDRLPYKNKIMFTAKDYPQYRWAIQVPQFKRRHCVDVMTDFANFKGQRYYETCYDIAAWIRDCSKGNK